MVQLVAGTMVKLLVLVVLCILFSTVVMGSCITSSSFNWLMYWW